MFFPLKARQLLSLACLICFFFDEISSVPVTIKTRLGNINGTKEPTPDYTTSVYKFYNIPYAKPPVGNLRFAKSEPYGRWNVTLNATSLGLACMQAPEPYPMFTYNGFSEDCLQLNIYVPNNISSNIKRSVMVWIHGGAYQFGSGTLYNGTMLAARGDVVVVTINYRLGIFGFLSYNDTSARGNFGIWDQILALQWIQENIADYTGDPSSVTIFGESAGGFSVSLLSVMPSIKGLFKRVIAESGVADSFFALTDDSKLVSVALSDAVGCIYDPITKNYNAMLNCMRSKNAGDILKTLDTLATDIETSIRVAIPLAPVIDGELFNDLPSKVLSNKNSPEFAMFRSLDMIVGNCNMEGSLYLLTTVKEQEKYKFNITNGIPNSFLCKHFAPSLSGLYYHHSLKVSEAICNEYSVQDNIDEQSRQVLEMYTDLFFIAPSFSILESHSNNNTYSKTYQYVFTQKSPLPFGPPRPTWYRGSGHASEVVFLFGIEDLHYSHLPVSTDQFDLALRMKDYWTNFAKTGNPNSKETDVHWPEFNTETKSYMQLNDNNLTRYTYYNSDRVKFWLVTIPNML
ncbi:Cholinesterase,Putative inactive carboxylesterase 4 [Mytilus coruscus]|uniref:Cholinesterase,Putative inactive carboxylesterase 4 n=1 Tax=Mytilus coruscus TaxID=42192 RepID=A0A6J8D7T6_MYTCO|nr:Cholinesterase,Putative inactive carboxylesterase 4 [Mytilus coruscus]